MNEELNKLTTDELETMMLNLLTDQTQGENILEILKYRWFQEGIRLTFISNLGTSHE